MKMLSKAGTIRHLTKMSFGEKDGVLKTFGQGNDLTINLKDLRAAIASGEVKMSEFMSMNKS
jgi:hypothetical protein